MIGSLAPFEFNEVLIAIIFYKAVGHHDRFLAHIVEQTYDGLNLLNRRWVGAIVGPSGVHIDTVNAL